VCPFARVNSRRTHFTHFHTPPRACAYCGRVCFLIAPAAWHTLFACRPPPPLPVCSATDALASGSYGHEEDCEDEDFSRSDAGADETFDEDDDASEVRAATLLWLAALALVARAWPARLRLLLSSKLTSQQSCALALCVCLCSGVLG
jgi:hypothetical protein